MTPHNHNRLTHQQTNNNPDLSEQIGQLKSADLDLFLKIIALIQKHYLNCTNNRDKVKTTMLIVKELYHDS